MTNLNLIEQVAVNHGVRGSVWSKKGLRYYINDCRITSIYNTKKTSQKVYIDLESFEVNCYTDCPSQGYSWCKNESNRVMEALQPLARLFRIASKK